MEYLYSVYRMYVLGTLSSLYRSPECSSVPGTEHRMIIWSDRWLITTYLYFWLVALADLHALNKPMYSAHSKEYFRSLYIAELVG